MYCSRTPNVKSRCLSLKVALDSLPTKHKPPVLPELIDVLVHDSNKQSPTGIYILRYHPGTTCTTVLAEPQHYDVWSLWRTHGFVRPSHAPWHPPSRSARAASRGVCRHSPQVTRIKTCPQSATYPWLHHCAPSAWNASWLGSWNAQVERQSAPAEG